MQLATTSLFFSFLGSIATTTRTTLALSLILSLSAAPALALEPRDPSSLCDRFLGSDQETCEKKISELNPDWYLAAVCNRQFDDKLFFECVGLSQKHSFSPLSLEPCDASELSDMDRMKCVTGAKVPAVAQGFQDERVAGGGRKPASTGTGGTGRKPASLPAKNKH